MTDGQVRLGSGLVKSTCIFLDEIFYKKEKRKRKMYLKFGKSRNKLLNIKCITLNSPLCQE